MFGGPRGAQSPSQKGTGAPCGVPRSLLPAGVLGLPQLIEMD